MSPTSAYQSRIRTDSDDSNGVLLIDNGELVAILVELADEIHGDQRGHWVIETTFGLQRTRGPKTFARASDAADWVSENINQRAFVLSFPLAILS